ncbi:hypothetical protein ACJMK2_029583 [Sinanodonta woodiana]|uniref:Protein SON n=1 Tax=Sinanodonta woodiana TaxID=1069815 RepID=A0ABD3XCL2_SINWO
MSKATDIDSIPLPEPEPVVVVPLPSGKYKSVDIVHSDGENDVKQPWVREEGDIQSDARSDENESSRLDARPLHDINLFKRAITEATKDSVARDKYGKLSQSIVDDMFKDFLTAKMHQIESEYKSKKESGGIRAGNATEEDIATSVEEMSKLLDAEINQLNAGHGDSSLGRTPSVTAMDIDGTAPAQNIKIEVSADSMAKDNSNSNPGKAPSAGSKKLGFMHFGIKLSAASAELISSGEKHDKTGRRLEEEDTCGSNTLKGEVSSYSGSSVSGSGDDDDNVSGTGSLSDSDKEGKSSKSKKKRKKKHKHKHKKKQKTSKEKDKSDGFDEKDKDRERSTISKRKLSHRSRSRSRSPRRSRRSRSRSGSRSRFRDERKSRSRSRSGERELPRSSRFGEFDAHVYRNYRRNLADNDRFRERRGGRSHSSLVSKEKRSRSRSQERKVEDLRLKIDKDKLREIAIKNALANAQTGQGPKIDVTLKAGGKSVEELTNFCKRIASKESKIGAENLSSSGDEALAAAKSDDDDSLIHHPFKMKQHANIVMDIRNAKQLPVLTPAERAEKSAQLRIQFPVSSGSVHRMKEEWIPVDTTISATSTKTTVTTSIAKSVAVTPTQIFVPTLPPPPPPPDDKVFPDPPAQDIDISAIISERLHAVRKLQENPYDPVAQSVMAQAQQRASLWAQSKLLPGQFLGSTGATILSQQELMGPDKKRQAWAKKDQFTNAAPLQGGIGMYLLQKMGWKQGEGLGKNNEGAKEPLILDFKVDRRGLKSSEEGPKKPPPGPRVKDLSGKHPVSALVEFCNKRKWGQPQFEVVQETGPDHKKSFLFKVRVNGQEFQAPAGCNNKKTAKMQAASVCLQELGLIPREGSRAIDHLKTVQP